MHKTAELLVLNHRGIFPGPQETEEAFFLRSHSLVPLEIGGQLSSVKKKALRLTKDLFDVSPDWVDVTVGEKGLFFWEGAALWIEETQEKTRRCQIQLKDSFFTRLYLKEEMLAHEMVHAMRLMFDEKRFEEILAYRTSLSAFRRYFGPLCSSPLETKIFLGSVFITWVGFFISQLLQLNVGGGLLLLPLTVFVVGLFRLIRSQHLFSVAERHVKQVLKRGVKPLPILLHLTDQEIVYFAKNPPDVIYEFVKSEQAKSLRWKQLFPFFTSTSRSDF